jgi:hypothetical protein
VAEDHRPAQRNNAPWLLVRSGVSEDAARLPVELSVICRPEVVVVIRPCAFNANNLSVRYWFADSLLDVPANGPASTSWRR